jgi:hypothetical protein
MISRNGIILNADKFQFCADEIEFALEHDWQQPLEVGQDRGHHPDW